MAVSYRAVSGNVPSPGAAPRASKHPNCGSLSWMKKNGSGGFVISLPHCLWLNKLGNIFLRPDQRSIQVSTGDTNSIVP